MGNQIFLTRSYIPLQVRDDMTLFAFMTHTHALGSDVSGFILHQGQLKEFASGDPQKPQTFHQMETFQVARRGDVLLARCTFDGTRANKTTSIGMFKVSTQFTLVLMTLHPILQDIGLAMQCASFLSCITSTRAWILS